MSADPLGGAPTPGLIDSLRRLLSTLVLLLQTRVELLATEIEEELLRLARLLLWSAAGLLCAAFGLLWAAITVLILLWDSHRVAAALGIAVVFTGAALVSAWVVRRGLRQRPPLLAATREELRRDSAMLDERELGGDA
jgi:uncharacterized membrane protein YqjE